MFGWGKKDKEPEKKPVRSPAVAVETPPDRSDFKVKVGDRRSCSVTLQIQVPAARVEQATEESFRDIQSRARLPGFRAGKAPLDLVKKSFEGSAREAALDRILRQTVPEALEREKVEAVASPVVDKIEYNPGKPLKFEVRVECAPQVSLKNYKGLPLTKKVRLVTDADVDKKIEEIREANAKLVESQADKVGAAHFVVVDYEGSCEGRPLEGGKAQGQLIDMAAPQTLAGFTEGILGAGVGETREVSVAFPADHFNKALAGKRALFRVTVTAIKEKHLPALDDEFAKDVGGESLAALKDRIRKNMEAELARAARQDLERQASDRLLESHVFDVPPSIVEERTHYLNHQIKQYLMRQGASEEDWKANEEKMAAKNRVEAEKQVRLSYLLTAVGEAEKIEVSDAEVEDLVRKSVEGVEPARRDDFRKWMEGRRDALRSQIREEKIFAFLIEQAKVTEVPFQEEQKSGGIAEKAAV